MFANNLTVCSNCGGDLGCFTETRGLGKSNPDVQEHVKMHKFYNQAAQEHVKMKHCDETLYVFLLFWGWILDMPAKSVCTPDGQKRHERTCVFMHNLHNTQE